MRKTILVVDDDPQYVGLVKDVLETQQHRVIVAANGEEALTLVAQHRFDVVVSDIEMPRMNGIVFHQKLIENKTYSNIPFIFLSATEDPEKLRHVREHPRATLLSKSDTIETLLATISSVAELQ